jgi:hypothetical protein
VSDHALGRDPGPLTRTSHHSARGSETPGPPIRALCQCREGEAQLVRLVEWIESDELVRTEDELVAETMHELGYQRRGARIVRRIEAAISQARR